MRDVLKFSHFLASKSTFSYEFSQEPELLLSQNRCFVRGFRHFSSHLTKCHACYGICTLPPLHTALTLRFAKNRQTDTSEVLRLPRELTMQVSKVLHVPRKMQLIVWKRRKHIAFATQNDFCLHLPHKTTFVTLWNMPECHKVPHLPRETKLCDVWNPKSDPFAKLAIGTAISRKRLRTVANGCGLLRTVKQRRANTPSTPRPPDPQSETGTLATHSGRRVAKKWWNQLVMRLKLK